MTGLAPATRQATALAEVVILVIGAVVRNCAVGNRYRRGEQRTITEYASAISFGPVTANGAVSKIQRRVAADTEVIDSAAIAKVRSVAADCAVDDRQRRAAAKTSVTVDTTAEVRGAVAHSYSDECQRGVIVVDRAAEVRRRRRTSGKRQVTNRRCLAGLILKDATGPTAG